MSRTTPAELSSRTLAVVMAGGNGTRLGRLTRWHSKPALPFGGQYRNIDFPLSNCVNSGIRRIALLTQYKAHSLIQHVMQGWGFLRPEIGEFIELWPAQQRLGQSWYAGTADAVFQNIDIINDHAPDYVLVLAGDHVYKMDYRTMIQDHVERGADVTVGCVEVPLQEAEAFGIMGMGPGGLVKQFAEKPRHPVQAPGNGEAALASMGIYVFDRQFLVDRLIEDAADPASRHDFGRDILPALIERYRVVGHAFSAPYSAMQPYWRDVGTLDSYWRANMELLAEAPEFDLYDERWPIWTHQMQCPPPMFTAEGAAKSSIVCGGCRISGTVHHSILSPGCRVDRGSEIEETVVLPNVRIGRNCRIRRAIIDAGCVIPDGTVIGRQPERDAERFEVSPSNGIVLVTAEQQGELAQHRQVA